MIAKLKHTIKWKSKQVYASIRTFNNEYFTYLNSADIRFIVHREDYFSKLLYIIGKHENVEMRWCERWLTTSNEITDVIDCGANIGYFSAYLSQKKLANQIFAIEGNNDTAELCLKTMQLLKINNVHVLKGILSDKSSNSYSIPNLPNQEPWQRAISISVEDKNIVNTTLDAIIMTYNIIPSLIKIDCEGFEAKILKGASNILSTIRPAFMIECNDEALQAANSTRCELFNVLLEANYNLFHLSSFTGDYPFGKQITVDFPALEFNFAAIPNDALNLKRWKQSMI